MTQVIANLLKKLTGATQAVTPRAKTVDGVMSVFEKTLDDLDHVRGHHLGLASSHQQIIDRSTLARQQALNEAERASNVHERLSAIVR
jgi:hypothetical protein